MTNLTRTVIDLVEDEFSRIIRTVDEFDLDDDESFEAAADRLVAEMGPGVSAHVREERYEYTSSHRSEYGSLYGSYESGYGSSYLGDDD